MTGCGGWRGWGRGGGEEGASPYSLSLSLSIRLCRYLSLPLAPSVSRSLPLSPTRCVRPPPQCCVVPVEGVAERKKVPPHPLCVPRYLSLARYPSFPPSFSISLSLSRSPSFASSISLDHPISLSRSVSPPLSLSLHAVAMRCRPRVWTY